MLRVDLDWPVLIAMGQRHGLLPLLYSHLSNAARPAVPEPVFDEIRTRAHAAVLRNLRLTGELLSLLGEFRRAGIPVLPFKGPVLAAAVYRSLALRPFIDLDILVRKRDLGHADELLRSRGYRSGARLTGAQQIAHERFEYARSFVGKDQLCVDLHWGLAKNYFSAGLTAESIWGHTHPVCLDGVTVPSLSPETLLLTLCWHGAKHGPVPWPRLIWIADIAELMCGGHVLEWSEVWRRARRSGSLRMVRLGLRLARDLLNAPLPAEVRERVDGDGAVRELADLLSGHLVGPAASRWTLARRTGFDLRLRERLRDKVRYCTRRLLVPGPREWDSLSLPRALAPLYFAVRLARLSTRYLFRLKPQTAKPRPHELEPPGQPVSER